MSTFDLSAFAPARPAVHLGNKLRREWVDLMGQLLVHGKTISDGKELTEEEKRHEITKWESLTARVVAAKDLGKSHPLDIKFTFPDDVYATVAEVQKKLDRWKLELAAVPQVKSGRKSMAVAVDDPPETSSSRSSHPNARPVVEIQVRNRAIRGPINHDNQQNDPPCERCKGRYKCIGRKGGGACKPCSASKTKCSLSSGNRGLAAVKAPGTSTLFSAATKEKEVEVEVVEATPEPIRTTKRKRSEREGESRQDDELLKRRIREIEAELLEPISTAKRTRSERERESRQDNEVMEATPEPIRTTKRKRSEREGESRQDDEPLKRRIREIEAELLQLAHDISNKVYQLAVEVREMGESLGSEDRK